jgi:hypothetical protein
MQLRRARVTPAIWVLVHDPPEKDQCVSGRTRLDLCCQTNVFTSRKESLTMVDGFVCGKEKAADRSFLPAF